MIARSIATSGKCQACYGEGTILQKLATLHDVLEIGKVKSSPSGIQNRFGRGICILHRHVPDRLYFGSEGVWQFGYRQVVVSKIKNQDLFSNHFAYKSGLFA
jgi:hypothetical protein